MAETKIIVDIGQTITQLQNNPRLGDELGKLLLKDVWTEAQGAFNDAATMFTLVRAMVHSMLAEPSTRGWTYQGLGMVRTNLDTEGVFRLNVWHHSLRLNSISCIHTHPWDLKSYCLNGEIINVRYEDEAAMREAQYLAGPTEIMDSRSVYPATGMLLGCGSHPNGAQMGDGSFNMLLYPKEPEVYHVGDAYVQGRDEIHESRYVDGTVTLNVRTNRRDDQSATVFWPQGQPWVDAKQRNAASSEVFDACACALSTWAQWPAQAGT